jgi:hypothetical protein
VTDNSAHHPAALVSRIELGRDKVTIALKENPEAERSNGNPSPSIEIPWYSAKNSSPTQFQGATTERFPTLIPVSPKQLPGRTFGSTHCQKEFIALSKNWPLP